MNTNIESSEKNMSITHCPNCGKHCPIDAVNCGKGETFVEKLKNGEIDPNQLRQELAEHEKNFHGDHEKKGHHGEGGHHHGHYGHHDYPHDGSLISLFHQCMHHIHHADGHHSSQGRLLRILAEEGNLTQKEMQECLKIKAGSLSELASKLETKGLLTRERDENDKRKISLNITPEGLEVVNHLHPKKERQDPFSVLTKDEQEALRGLLTKILENKEE